MKKLNLFKSLFSVLVLLLGVGNAWASKTYYATMNVAVASTGGGTVYVNTSGTTSQTKTASSTSSSTSISFNIYATASAGYRFSSWSGSGITFGSTTTANTTGAISSNSTSSPGTSKTATASFVAIEATAAPANVNIAAEDPSATYPENTDERTLTFTTTTSNALTDFTYAPANGASGKYTFANWRRVDATHVAVDYTFAGGGNYGGLSRVYQVNVTLKGKEHATTQKCTITATFPNAKVTGGSDVSLTSSFKATDATQAGKSWTAVFDVENVDYVSGDNNNFDTPTFTGTDAARFSLDPTTPMSYADGKVTVNFIYNGNKEATTHTATLTLKVKDAIGGTDATYGSKSVTVTAVNKEEANYDVDVYNASGTKISNNTTMWADGITLAKNNPGSTIVLARNINLGTITAAYEISKNTTIDLNGKELRAGVNKKEIGILNVNGTGITLTIKDVGLGGGGVMINEYALNNQMRTITVTKGTLTLEGGTIAVNNTTQYRYGTTDYTDGIANVVSMSTRAIHQAAGTTVNIKGGKVQSKASRNGYCIYQASSAATQRAETSVLNISDGEIYSECSNRAYGVAAYGLVNLSGGTITAKLNTETVNANTVYVNKYPTDGNYVIHNYAYALQMNGGASVTATSNYYGVLNMTGGEVVAINENVHATATTNLHTYGIFFNAGSVNVKTGTASDGTYSQKWAAVGDISGGSVRVENTGTLAYGVFVAGEYNSHDDSHTVTKIKNFKVDVTAYQSAYGVYANASVGTTSNNASPNMGAEYAGDVELTNTTVNATTTDGTTAYALMVVSTYGTVFKNATMTNATAAGYTQVYDGEFASAAKMTVNSGTYTAETKKSSSAYAAASSTRSRTIFASTTSTNASRELGGHKEAYAELNIHGGTFTATTSTSEARAVSVGGHTTIDGGHFYANAGSSTARGIYCVSGTLKVSGVDVHSEANSSAFGISLSGGISDNTGFSYSADAELNNLTVDVKTRTGNEADGVLMEVTKKNLPTIPTSGEYMNMYQKGEYAIAPKAIINGGTYTVTSQGTSAYGVSLNSAPLCEDINGDGILAIGEGDLTIKNAEFTVKTKTGNAAYGVWAGGKTSVENTKFTITSATSDAYGLRAYYGKSTIKNSTFDVTATTATAVGLRAEARMSTVNSSNSHHTTNFSGVEGYDLIGEIESEGNTLTVRADGGNTAYGIQVISAKGSGTKTTAAAGLAFKGDHACAGKAVVNGGKYTATASGTTAYAVIVSDPAVQGELTATPECIVNDGKFYGYATGGTYADVSVNGETGYFVLNGGYYVKDENLDKKLGEEMNKVATKSGTPEKTEGYNWHITGDMTGEAVCKITQNNTSYASLEEALQVVNASPSSTWTIVMTANYTLSKGDYEIPANTSLLIPYKSGQTKLNGTTPAWVNKNASPTPTTPSPYLKLTFANGVNMTVKGNIEASSTTYINQNNWSGVVGGPFGWLYLNEGSHIDLESGAYLFAWGYVTGKGEINAKNGSYVYEDFQMGDWRGGTMGSSVNGNTNGLGSKGVFLLTDYYFQNVECPITYRPGANSIAYTGAYMEKSIITVDAKSDPVNMIGISNAMFLMNPATAGSDTWVRKEYDAEKDQLIWTMNSGASLGSFTLKLNTTWMDVNMTTSDYVLPMATNFKIVANEGDINITNDVCFLPGSEAVVNKEANLVVASGKRVFIYDQDDWSTYGGYYHKVGYSPSWKACPRSATKLPDARIEVAGSIQINGSLYTTAGGGNIFSTRENAGKIRFGAAAPTSTSAMSDFTGNSGKDKTLCQLVGNGSEGHYVGKALDAAQLKNEDGGYTSTTGAAAGDIYAYMADPSDGVYRWLSVKDVGCFTEIKGADTKQYIHPSDFVAVEANTNGDHAYHNEGSTRYFVNAEKASSNASCVWWEAEPKGIIDGVTYYMANNENFDNYGTYFYWDNSVSYWKPKKITVTWKDKDGNKITNGSFGDSYNFNTSPQFFGANPVWANTSTEKHDWIGWRDENGNIYDKNATLPVATGDVTYTAYFQTSKYQYTITFKNEDDNKVIWAGLMDAGDPAVCPVAPTQESTVSTVYTFSNWVGYAANATLPTITGPATYTAHYTSSTRQYHVTFYNYDAVSVLYEADVDYNTRPVYDGVTPFRSNTSAFSYEWTGWQQGATHYGTTDNLALVTGDVYYVATFSQTDLKYQVLFKRQDGSIIDAPFFNFEETPAAFPANPTLASTVSTDYTFDHWDPADLQPVTVDGMVYTAYFTGTTRQYTAHFVNYDGTSLGVDQTIDYNTVPAYTGATPFHPNDSRNSYEFAGWAWEAGDDWEAGSIGVSDAFPAIKANITFTAQFDKTLLQFNVRYIREDGTPLKEEKLKWGESTTGFPSVSNYEDDTYSYTFVHWSPATVVNPVEKDATYTAYFNQAIKTYSFSNIGINPAGYGSVSPSSVTGIQSGASVTQDGNKLKVNGTVVCTATPTAADAQYTYTFDHWNNVPATVTGNVTNIEAVFTRTVNTYSLSIAGTPAGYGSVSASSVPDVAYGASVTKDGNKLKVNGTVVCTATPTTSDAQYTYAFDHWNNVPATVTGDVTNIEAVFTRTVNTYSLSIAGTPAGYGSVSASSVPDVAYGASVTKDGNKLKVNGEVVCTATPTAADAQYTYTFDHWNNVPATVTGNVANIQAVFTRTVNTYSLTIAASPAGYGSVSASSVPDIAYGASVTKDGNKLKVNGTVVCTATPTAADAQYTYAFDHWNNVPATVTGNVTNIQAVFTRTVNTYTVTWKNEDGTPLETDENVAYGTTPTYNGATPTKTNTAEWTYTFTGWDNTPVAVTGAATYIATFSSSKNSYEITWLNDDNSLIDKTTVEYGVVPTHADATKANTAEWTYTFTGWDNTPVAVTGVATYKATFSSSKNSYEITWLNDDNSLIDKTTVEYGVVPTHADATKANTAEYTYTFSGWSPAITSVTGAATYTAQFGSTVNKYTITWKNQDGEVLRTDENVEYGQTPSYGSEPTLDPTESTVYTFVQWIPEVVSVTKDTTITANYTAAPRPYPVVWKNYNGDVLKESTRLWGWDAPAASAYDGVTPTKPGDANRTCAFSGWSDPISVVEGGDVTYTAQFNVSMLITEATPLTITSEETATTTTVKVSGKLDVTAGTLTTNELILEASENASGEIITGKDNIVVPSSGNAYFDLAHAGGFKANTWYAIAVPWMVNVPAGGKGGVSIKQNGEYKSQKLGYDFDLIYYDGARRANGDVKAWNFLQDDPVSPAVDQHVMTPGVAYMIYLTEDAETIRFQRRASAPLHTEGVEVSAHESTNPTYKNWNGIANPATYHAYMNAHTTDSVGQVYVAETRQYKKFHMGKNKLLVGQPIFIQPDKSRLVFAKDTYNDDSSTPVRRRAKRQFSLTRYELYLAPSQDVATDEIIVRMSEEKEENDYVVGQDLVKMGVSDLVPQMWIDRYDCKMFINTVAGFDNTADYPLGIFVPKNGEYDLFLDDELDSESNLYLTYDGEAIWNLSYGPYVASLEKGTNTHYGLRIVKKAPQITTGIDEATIQNGEAVRKVLVNDKVYIIRNGQKYSVTGQKAK